MIKRILKLANWLFNALCIPGAIMLIGFSLASLFTGYTVPLWWSGVSYSPWLDLAFGWYLIYLGVYKD